MKSFEALPTEQDVPELEEQFVGSQYILPEQSADATAKAINFKNSLGEVQQHPIQVIDFDSVVNQANKLNHKALSQGCLEIVHNEVLNAPHTYFYSHDERYAERLQRLTNVFISRTSIGETSAHKVFFALLTSDDDRIRVAVKPFVVGDNVGEKAVTDWSNTLLARKNGLETFQPIGFMICNGAGFTLTERQDDVDSMDNVDWSRVLFMPESYQNMIDDAKKVGPALARINHRGIFHGDTNMKNGVLTQRGSMHWIDWEAATFIDLSREQSTQQEAELVHKKTTRDLTVLFNSLVRSVSHNGVGLLDGLTPLAQFQAFNEIVLGPYMDERLRLMSDEPLAKDTDSFAKLVNIEQEVASYIMNSDFKANLNRSRND